MKGLPPDAVNYPWGDPVWYTEQFLWIRSKDKRVIPFRLNRVQRKFAQGMTRRDLIFKGRQLGFSTWNLARLYHDTITNEGVNTKIVAHKREAAELLLETVRLFYDRSPEWSRPAVYYNSKWQMSFPEMRSQITITASGEGAGRSETIHNLLATEVAFWRDPEKELAALLESVPHSGTAILESTPAGAGDFFYGLVERARKGQGPWKLHEYLWWEDDEYRLPLEPGESLEPYSDEEKALIAAHHLTPEQIKWRREKISEITYARFCQEYEGEFVQAGRGIFDQAVLRRWLLEAQEPLPGYPDGWRVYEPPQEGVRYVIGADVAEGIADGDADAAVVWRWDVPRVVAVIHGWWAPEQFAAKLQQAGQRYNWALVAPERNNHGHVVILKLREWRYPNLAWWQKKPGWETNAETKALIIDSLEEAIRKERVEIPDAETIRELQAFVDLGRGKMGAVAGAHDDLVMAAAIGHYVRQVAVGTERNEDGVTARIIG